MPCAGCTACCTSSQFVHIGADEVDTLAHIPAELLFPAPLRPPGDVVLGYDDRGHCPMLVDGGCSIYEHRPMTCRIYDCRVFPAAGVVPTEPDKLAIARRATRWQFSFPDVTDGVALAAVRAAATLVQEHGELVPAAVAPTNTTQLAVLAVEVHDLFLGRDDQSGAPVAVEPAPEVVPRR